MSLERNPKRFTGLLQERPLPPTFPNSGVPAKARKQSEGTARHLWHKDQYHIGFLLSSPAEILENLL